MNAFMFISRHTSDRVIINNVKYNRGAPPYPNSINGRLSKPRTSQRHGNTFLVPTRHVYVPSSMAKCPERSPKRTVAAVTSLRNNRNEQFALALELLPITAHQSVWPIQYCFVLTPNCDLCRVFLVLKLCDQVLVRLTAQIKDSKQEATVVINA